ncbi:MAG: hypothetical protein KTR14_09060, partial [Vampirovibrio sp.]|nr:hypothetical protein [Vampirovibrio sp.]
MTLETSRKQAIDRLLETLDLASPDSDHAYDLYHHALTHSSYTYENKLATTENYERLEFLGDAVLKLIVSEYLYDRFPDYREGDLTKIRAVVVSDARLAEIALQIDLGAFMVFGASEARSGGAKKTSNLACGFEAMLGALFLDGKMSAARNLLCGLL